LTSIVERSRPEALVNAIPVRLRQPGRYFVVSLVALAVDFGVLVALMEFTHLRYLTSSAVSYITGSVVNYLLCIAWVFRVRRIANPWTEFVIFFGVGLVGLAATQVIIKIAVEGLGLSYAIGKVGAVGASFLINFALRRVLLFTKKPIARTANNIRAKPISTNPYRAGAA
jgi:putative flippase GtrA